MTDSREGPDTVVEIFPGGVIVEVMERFLHHISVESDMRALPSFLPTLSMIIVLKRKLSFSSNESY